ncbi:MAG: pimeloyl-ACP methyl ester esterase BioH, partial [Gammaproteobacteria bacterium]|nr:pimeloyl-ACP methyl ester esterase BioH [Gammaproteobacteria bacterium]MCW8987874.1 pimeloyl-ACP methyl ester esterase BioH [Gammaproteobacteria bacterium]
MSAVLYSEVKGTGKDVVLLHGWGMHGGLWGRFSDLLADGCRCHIIDLPGYGYSKDSNNEFTLDSITEDIEDYINYIDQQVTVIGWSLGGLFTLNLLKRKNIDVSKIVLIATTPRFTKDEKSNWLNAMEQHVFDDFAVDLQNDYKKTLTRFLSLQTRGSELARDDLRLLNQKLTERGDPDINALKNGLKILSDTDLRNKEQNNIPAMLVLGEKDTLVPVAVKSEFSQMFSNIEQLVLEKTGHAPFISKPEICADKIKKFLNE